MEKGWYKDRVAVLHTDANIHTPLKVKKQLLIVHKNLIKYSEVYLAYIGVTGRHLYTVGNLQAWKR